MLQSRATTLTNKIVRQDLHAALTKKNLPEPDTTLISSLGANGGFEERLRSVAPSRRSREEGFTFVEVIVITIILLIMAAIIIPNYLAYQRSASEKELEASIARLPLEAKNEAVKLQTPVAITVSDSALILQEEPSASGSSSYAQSASSLGTNTTTLSTSSDPGTTPIQLQEINLGSTLQIANVEMNGQSSDTGSFMWTVYPDGSADEAGIEFTEGTVHKSLVLTSTGDSRWITGDLPDQSQDQWPAGQVATQSSQSPG